MKSRSQPRANGKPMITTDERTDILDLLQSFGEIPLHCLTLLYKSKYDRVLDCLSKKAEGGILGYLDSMLRDMINIRTDSNENMFVSLIDPNAFNHSESKENIRPLLRKRQFERDTKAFFNPDSILWRGRIALLDRRNLKIELSLFEQQQLSRKRECREEIRKIRRELSKHQNGIEMGKFGYLVPISTSVFPGRANDHIIFNLPELFYTVDREGKTILYDGFTHTREDLTGRNDELFARNPPTKIVEDALRNGLYQKTLIIMREKGLAGLKIHVWRCSMERNFYYNKKSEEKQELDDYDQMEFFMALARFGLVEISSSKDIKNDLRAFIPKKKPEEIEPIFERFCKQRSHSVF